MNDKSNKPLRVYYAGSKEPYEHDFVDACFARSWEEARRLIWAEGEYIQHECNGDRADMSVRVMPEFDGLAEALGVTHPCIPADPDVLRRMGFGAEGDDRCDCCNLCSMDDLYPVCGTCYRCPECGHADDCPEAHDD